ncbi:MAG: hypothetical protein AB7G39_09140 [Alphaproteobacteria bacterium]
MLRLSHFARMAVLPLFLLGGCADTPRLAGNTFRTLSNDPLGVNVSYDFQYLGEASYTVPNKTSADAWLFQNMHHAYPGEYLQVLHVKELNQYETGPGDVVNLGRKQYKSQLFCVAWSGEGIAQMEHGDELLPYMDFLHRYVDASRFAMIRRFIPQRRDDDHDRVDIVFIEDMVRYGFDCKPFADPSAPEGDGAKDYLTSFKIRSLRAFEIIR